MSLLPADFIHRDCKQICAIILTLPLVEARTKTASTIFCSQMDVPGWHENLYDPTLADAICDRIVHDSYVIQIHGESMRKRKGILE